MTGRRPLTHNGVDVVLCTRAADGRAVFLYLDRHGTPTRHGGRAWPHQLRGIGRHIADIKDEIKRLPEEGSPAAASPPSPPAEPKGDQRRGRIHAHFALTEDDR